jgi:iron complex outermembrane receptor protein
MRPGWYAQGTGSGLQADDLPLSGDFVPNALQPGGARNNSSRRNAKTSLKFGWTPRGRGECAVTYVLQRGLKDVPPYAGTDSAVRPRFWRWPDWDKDSVCFVSNTPLRGSQYLKGRAYCDRFYNELDAFDDARYTTMMRPSSFRSIYDDYSSGGSVEHGVAIGGRQTFRPAGHLKEDIHREHHIGEPIPPFQQPHRLRGCRGHDHGFVDRVADRRHRGGPADDRAGGKFRRRGRLRLSAGLGGVNPQVRLFVATPDGGRVRVDVSRKTRLPAIKDRFSYRMGAAIPNPDLRAEQATTAEAGYDRAIDRYGTVSLVGYYTAVNDLSSCSTCSRICFNCRTWATCGIPDSRANG